jgi:hypothetical protein
MITRTAPEQKKPTRQEHNNKIPMKGGLHQVRTLLHQTIDVKDPETCDDCEGERGKDSVIDWIEVEHHLHETFFYDDDGQSWRIRTKP